MARVFNFAAGPSALPESVLTECAEEMLDYRGCGMSVLEMSHRSSTYQQIFDETEATLRRIVDIPSDYKVLFLQGGATLQFAGIPMNLMATGRAAYIVSGNFSKKAYQEACKYGEADGVATSEWTHFDRVPSVAGVGTSPPVRTTPRARLPPATYRSQSVSRSPRTVSYTHLTLPTTPYV